MDFNNLVLHFQWFNNHALGLKHSGDELDCLRRDVDGIRWHIDDIRFLKLAEAVAKLRKSILDEPCSMKRGSEMLHIYESQIRRTARDYLVREAESTADSKKITAEMDKESF